MANDNKCAHEICDCAVPEGEKYCSDHCKEAEDQGIIEISCDCGHPACE